MGVGARELMKLLLDMNLTPQWVSPSRRRWIVAMLTIPSAARAADAWKKKYAAWSLDDARAILSHSPWAQTGKIEFKIQGNDVEGPRSGGVIGPPEGPPGGNGSVGPPGGAPARAGGGIVQNGPGLMPDFRALVRWESALPMRLAQGMNAKSGGADEYVISVTGFPILRADVASSLGALKGATRLERMGKEWLRPSRAESRESGNSIVLVFTFDGESAPITGGDKVVMFATKLGAMSLRVKFNLKDMTYEHQLAL